MRDTLEHLSPHLRERVGLNVPIAPLTTLRVGGAADAYLRVHTEAELIEAVAAAQRSGSPWFLLGGGSNLCVSDRGIRGLVIHNRAADQVVGESTRVATGHRVAPLFLAAAAAGLSGLEFAVGIPGTVGGALVSNAGAYRQCIGPLVRSLGVVENGEQRRVGADWMEFGYRDSRLRHSAQASTGARACVTSVELVLRPGERDSILSEAREYQRNRIHRQPWLPSAGSFFKNVYDRDLAARVEGLPDELAAGGVVPAGYLSAACGCKGLRVGGAQISLQHANFIVNSGAATASDVRALAGEVKRRVLARFGVALEEEVIYAGEW